MSRESLQRVFRRKLTRRDLFKLAPLGGVAATALGLGLSRRGAAATRVTRGECRFCLFHCGVEVHEADGQVVRVEGDLASKTRGFLCLHGHALGEVVHSDHRVHAPMLRHADGFVEVGWDEALGEVAARLEKVKARYGAQALVVQTGWPLVRHPLIAMLHRFTRAFGTPNLVTVSSLCEASLRMGQALTVGSKYPTDFARAKTLVAWGANPPHSAPPFTHLFRRRAEEGHLVVVDPTRTSLAKEAKEHLQLRPGTDGALALGLCNLLIESGTYDRKFVEEHVVGFEAFRALAARFVPAEVERITSVPVDQLARVARMLTEDGPARLWQGLGVEHHAQGVQTVRAIVSLEALLGAFDAPWTQTQLTAPGPRFGEEPLPALYRMRTPEPVPPEVAARPLGYDRHPLFEIYNREAQGNLFARAVLEQDPYPVRALVLVGSNPFVTGPGSARMRKAADALELVVSIDPFLCASGRLADVVLPACTFAEVGAAPMVARQGLAKPDYEIIASLARGLGLAQYFPWATLDEALAAPTVPFMRDDAHQPRPTVAHADRFGTPSGKVELESSLLGQFGYSPLPEWNPPSPATDRDYPLLLVSGPRTRAFINSQFRDIPSVRSKQPRPLALIHPRTAAAVKVGEGMTVALVSRLGRVELQAHLTDEVHPDSVVAPSGWAEANINLLVDAEALDPISGFPGFRSVPCRVEPVKVATAGSTRGAVLGLALVAALLASGRAEAAACCASASVVGSGRLVAWEDAASGLNSSWARGVGRWDAQGKWIARGIGTSDDELRAELWAIVRLAEPLQLSARVPWVFGVRTSGNETVFGTGLGDVGMALRWDAVAVGAVPNVPGLALTASVVGPTGRRPEAATDPLGASITGRGVLAFSLGAAAEVSEGGWFARLDVGGTASVPFRRLDTGALQTYGPGVQVGLSGGRELWADRLVLAVALRFEHETPYFLEGELVPGSQSSGLSTALNASLKLGPHWHLVADVSTDVLGRVGIGRNRDERFGASLGVRYGFF